MPEDLVQSAPQLTLEGTFAVIEAPPGTQCRNMAIRFGSGGMNDSYSARLLMSSSGVGLLIASSLSTVDVMQAGVALQPGVALQRVWLRATRLGLAFCPVSVLPLLMLVRHRKGDALGFAQRAELERLDVLLRKLRDLQAQEHPLFLFRVGYAARAPVPSLRRSVAEVLDAIAFAPAQANPSMRQMG